MRSNVVLSVLCFTLALSTLVAAQDYGSYVAICDSSSANVTFVNFPRYNCSGEATVFTTQLNYCGSELAFFSWKGFCNSTNMWYINYGNSDCSGSSVLTRMYNTYQCQNCPNPECKNGLAQLRKVSTVY